MTEPTSLTFEDAYERLNTISTRVTSEEVPVAEMCDLFAEGKGLHQACMTYLDEQKSRVEAIERGEGIQAFRIIAPPAGSTESAGSSSAAEVVDEWLEADLDPTPAPAPAPPVSIADDDIPF